MTILDYCLLKYGEWTPAKLGLPDSVLDGARSEPLNIREDLHTPLFKTCWSGRPGRISTGTTNGRRPQGKPKKRAEEVSKSPRKRHVQYGNASLQYLLATEKRAARNARKESV